MDLKALTSLLLAAYSVCVLRDSHILLRRVEFELWAPAGGLAPPLLPRGPGDQLALSELFRAPRLTLPEDSQKAPALSGSVRRRRCWALASFSFGPLLPPRDSQLSLLIHWCPCLASSFTLIPPRSCSQVAQGCAPSSFASCLPACVRSCAVQQLLPLYTKALYMLTRTRDFKKNNPISWIKRSVLLQKKNIF